MASSLTAAVNNGLLEAGAAANCNVGDWIQPLVCALVSLKSPPPPPQPALEFAVALPLMLLLLLVATAAAAAFVAVKVEASDDMS